VIHRPGSTVRFDRDRTRPNGGGPRWAGLSSLIGVSITVAILLNPPVSAAPQQLGVVLKKPFSGTVYTNTSTTTYTGGAGAGSTFIPPPYFSLSRGHGGLIQESHSHTCKSNVINDQTAYSEFSSNSSQFTPSSVANGDHFRFRWTLTYSVYLSVHVANSSQSAEAYATVTAGASVVDTTVHRGSGSSTSYYNTTSLYNRNATVWSNVTSLTFTLLLVRSLKPTHSYELSAWVTVTTVVDAYGPRGSGDSAVAEVTFPNQPAGAVLDLVAY